MLVTVIPLAVVVAMLVLVQWGTSRKLPPVGFWVWLAAAAAFVTIMLWRGHAAGTPLLPKGVGLNQIGPFVITALLLLAICGQLMSRVRRANAGLPLIMPPNRLQVWLRWLGLVLSAGVALYLIFSSLHPRAGRF